jgi:hypothetical protein
LVTRLPDPVTSCFIAADGDDNACLYQTLGAGSATSATGDAATAWRKRQPNRLAAINAANREF